LTGIGKPARAGRLLGKALLRPDPMQESGVIDVSHWWLV